MRGDWHIIAPILEKFHKVDAEYISCVLLPFGFCFSVFCGERNSPHDCLCNMVRCRYFFHISGKLFSLRTKPLLAGKIGNGFDCSRSNFSKRL